MMKLAVKRILMDVDGTMTGYLTASTMDLSPLRHLIGLVMKRHCISESEAEQRIRRCGDPDTQCLSEFLPELDIEPSDYFDRLKTDLSKHIYITEDTVDFLKAMKERGIPVCAATTNSRFMTLAKLAVGGLAELNGSPYLAAYHPGCEFCDPMGKFSEHYFPNILKHHGYDPETTLMVGDEPERDLFPALKAGIRYGVIVDRDQTEECILRDGGIFIRSLKNLAEMID